ncbi:hypothetical protein [Nodularia chucula]|uniref:hypothetical protein n=1 Tax=Nodularia chucula TaxID=3093667 RepID=UPI0039C5EEAD
MGKAPPKAIANSLQMVLVSDSHPSPTQPNREAPAMGLFFTWGSLWEMLGHLAGQ